MPFNPRRVRIVVGCLGAALLAAIPALSSRMGNPAAGKATQTPAPQVVVSKAAPLQAPAVGALRHEGAPASKSEAVAAAKTTPSAKSIAAQSGMMAYIDPETGEFVSQPTGQESESATESQSLPFERTDEASLRSNTLSDGTVMVELDETYHDFTIVRLDASGKLVKDCLSGPEAAKLINTKPAAPAAASE